jgi:hypothetical protein
VLLFELQPVSSKGRGLRRWTNLSMRPWRRSSRPEHHGERARAAAVADDDNEDTGPLDGDDIDGEVLCFEQLARGEEDCEEQGDFAEGSHDDEGVGVSN